MNNLQNLDPDLRKELANNADMINFVHLAFGVHDARLAFVREAATVKGAISRANEAMAELGLTAPATGYTVADLYHKTGSTAVVGEAAGGKSVKCTPPSRWDPITQTCVPE